MNQINSEPVQGLILTDRGCQKIADAKDRWHREKGKKLTQEKIKDKTGLDSKTISKILNRKGGGYRDSIETLFRGLSLTLEEEDYACADAPEDQPPPTPPDGPTEPTLDDGLTRWVGREALIADLVEKLRGECRVLSVVGLTGIGKTSLAGQLAKNSTLKQFLPYQKTISFYQELTPSFAAVARFVLGDEFIKGQPQLLASENEDALVGAMITALQSQPFLLIIDMIEVVLEPDGKGGHQFIEPVFAKFLDRVVLADSMPTRVILTSQDRPPMMAQGRFLERNYTEPLRGLSEGEAMELFRQWQVDVEAEANASYLQRLIAIYEGHPLALRAIAGEIINSPYDGSVAAYWGDYGSYFEEVERLKKSDKQGSREDRVELTPSVELQELVATRIDASFQRLRQGYPLACRLLCMAAAAMRRADTRQAWLFLIRKFSPQEQSMAWQVLQRRLFLEEERSQDRVKYRLHGLMRQVGLKNLAELEKEAGTE